MWKQIKYAMGWYPDFKSLQEIIDYIKVGDIYVLCEIIKRYNHKAIPDKRNLLESAQDMIKNGYGDCYSKMALAKLVLNSWNWKTLRISLYSEVVPGHAILYFENGSNYGIISNGNLIRYLNINDKSFIDDVKKMVGHSTKRIYTRMRIY